MHFFVSVGHSQVGGPLHPHPSTFPSTIVPVVQKVGAGWDSIGHSPHWVALVSGQGANSQFGPVLPTALPSGHNFASIVQATGSCGKIPAHPAKRSANSIIVANTSLFIFSPNFHYSV
jgi:hypothetical protein